MTIETEAAPATEAVQESVNAGATQSGGKSEIADQLRGALEGDEPIARESGPREKLKASINSALEKETEKGKPVKGPDGRLRGPDGKFASEETVEQPAEATGETEEQPEATVPAEPSAEVGQAPTSWKKELQAKWAELPDWARNEITKREADVEKGFAKYQSLRSIEPVLNVVDQLAPQYGVTTPQVVQSWAESQAKLLQPNLAPAEVVRIAQQYLPKDVQVALGQYLVGGAQQQVQAQPQGQHAQPQTDPNAWVDPEVAQLRQQLSQLQTWQQQQTQREQEAQQRAIQQQQAQKVSAIDQFAAEKGPDGQPLRPHLDTVIPDMVAGIARIRSTNPQLSDQEVLQQAYESAVWSNPDTRQKVLEAQKLAEENERKAKARERAQAATRQAVSPASASPQGPPATAPVKGSIRDQMRHNYEQLLS